MIAAEINHLTLVKELISNSLVTIKLFEDEEKRLIVSSSANKPQGTVYFSTTHSLLYYFVCSAITLQTLFNLTPSFFVEIRNGDEKSLYSQKDAEIILKFGDKTFRQLDDTSSQFGN